MTSTGLGSPTPPSVRPTVDSSSSANVSYEKYAPRSASQIARLNRIAALTAGPATHEGSTTSGRDKNDFTNRHLIMECMHPPMEMDFGWESMLKTTGDQTDPIKETLRLALAKCDERTLQLKHTTSLRLALRASINIAEDISNRHADLIRHSGELSAAADRLQDEEAVLTRHAEEIGKPLQHYDAVDRIGLQVGVLFKGKATVRGLAKVKVDDDDFPAILDEIDRAVDYFGKECGGKEALEAELKRRSGKEGAQQQLLSGNIEYYRRALALQEAALSLIKEAVADRITNTAAQVSSTLNIPKVPVQADQVEASLIYTRFHGISTRSNRLLGLVKARLYHGDAYHELLQVCRSTFCTSRESLLRVTVQSHMDTLKAQHGPVGMTRLASVFLIRLCTLETSLYLDFFGDKKPDSAPESAPDLAADPVAKPKKKAVAASSLMEDSTFRDSEFQSYLTSLCAAFHRTVRRSLVTMHDLDTLCQIVSVLREERSMASASPITMAASRGISSVIEDAQERLIFCAQSTLTKDVIRFRATPSDLDYPEKLKKKLETAEVATATSGGGEDDAVERQLELVYQSWFPPIRGVLRILSKIFRVVEPRVFEDMALQAVQACIKSLRDGAAYIRQRRGLMHSDLFLVKHLLILREQLSPFDIELRSVERQLDFSDAGRAVSRFLANRNRRLFSMSAENALLTLLREGVSVQESSVDSKRDLEDALRSACNDFIEHTARSVSGDLLQMIEQIQSAESSALAIQALLNADWVEGQVAKMRTTSDETMGDVTAQMALYLENSATQSILLKPVNRKVSRTLDELRKMIGSIPDGDNGWDPDKRAKILEDLDSIDQFFKKGVGVKASR